MKKKPRSPKCPTSPVRVAAHVIPGLNASTHVIENLLRGRVRTVNVVDVSPQKKLIHHSPHKKAFKGNGDVEMYRIPLKINFEDKEGRGWRCRFHSDKPTISPSIDLTQSKEPKRLFLQGQEESDRDVKSFTFPPESIRHNPFKIIAQGRNQNVIMGQEAKRFAGWLAETYKNHPEMGALIQTLQIEDNHSFFQWLHLIAYRLLGEEAQKKSNLVLGTDACNNIMRIIELHLVKLLKTNSDLALTFKINIHAPTCVGQENINLATTIEYTIEHPNGNKMKFIFYPLSPISLPPDFSETIGNIMHQLMETPTSRASMVDLPSLFRKPSIMRSLDVRFDVASAGSSSSLAESPTSDLPAEENPRVTPPPSLFMP